MKRFVVYPDSMLEDMAQVLYRKEPFYLHWILFIVCGVMFALFGFLFFGKMDDVVKANGIVRPCVNVSSVNNIMSGEIECLFYRPGDFVHAGDKLLTVKSESLVAEEKAVSLQLAENKGNLVGIGFLIEGYEKGFERLDDADGKAKARFAAFVAERNLLRAKVQRTEQLYEQEVRLPESSTTESEIETLKYEYKMARLEYEQYCADFYSSLKQEKDALKLEREELLHKMAVVKEELHNLVLISPVDGFVQETSSLNIGDYLFADQQILNIVPMAEKNCRVELKVPAENVGKLREGQKVKLRFPAFPYSEFKGIDGVLNVIQPDSQISDSGSLFFTVYALADNLELQNKKGKVYQIKPGYEVNARIVLENQSLLYFLLKRLDFTV